MKRTLKIGGAVLLLLLLLVLVGGWLLKPAYRVERSVLIEAPAERIYAHLDSSEGWRRWGVWYRRDPAMQLAAAGPLQGAGARWEWRSESQGNGSMVITAAEPGRHIAYELRIDDFKPSTGELRLVQNGPRTQVIWLMQGDMGGNPVNRWLGLFMDKLVGPDFEAGLNNLKQLAESK